MPARRVEDQTKNGELIGISPPANNKKGMPLSCRSWEKNAEKNRIILILLLKYDNI